MKLEAGQEITGLVIKLTPQAIIFGKVVDEDGDPLPNFSLRAWRWARMYGGKQLQMIENQASMADGIRHRRPSRRQVLLSSAENGRNFGIELSGSRKPTEYYLKTYFPSELDSDSAALVDVAPGSEVRGIEIHVRRGRVFEIRGKAESDLGGDVSRWPPPLLAIDSEGCPPGIPRERRSTKRREPFVSKM